MSEQNLQQVQRILVETYSDHATSETTCRRFENKELKMLNALVQRKSLKMKNQRHYFVKTHVRPSCTYRIIAHTRVWGIRNDSKSSPLGAVRVEVERTVL